MSAETAKVWQHSSVCSDRNAVEGRITVSVTGLESFEPRTGLLVLMHSSLARMDTIRFQRLIPGRLAHIRIPHGRTNLDLVAVYQHVWRSQQDSKDNLAQRQQLLNKLGTFVRSLPSRNVLVIAGDFNTSLAKGQGVEPCAYTGSTLQPDSHKLALLISDHGQQKSGRPSSHHKDHRR